jgi:hypothetical protein
MTRRQDRRSETGLSGRAPLPFVFSTEADPDLLLRAGSDGHVYGAESGAFVPKSKPLLPPASQCTVELHQAEGFALFRGCQVQLRREEVGVRRKNLEVRR